MLQGAETHLSDGKLLPQRLPLLTFQSVDVLRKVQRRQHRILRQTRAEKAAGVRQGDFRLDELVEKHVLYARCSVQVKVSGRSITERKV